MANPRIINDGDFTQVFEVIGAPRFPFSDKGDFDSFEYPVKCVVDRDSFRKSASMSRKSFPLGYAYLVEHGDPSLNDVGCFEYDLTFASIPRVRTEGISTAFTMQYWRAVAGTPTEGFSIYPVNYEVAEQTFTYSGEVVYEYFNYKPEPLLYPRVFLVFEFLYSIASIESYSGRIVAADSDVGIYKGGIYYRRTPYVTVNAGSRV